MSSIAVSGNTSGTGEFSLEAPATTADRNITLTDVSGNVVISDGTTITADYTNNRFSFGGTVVFNGLTTGFNRWQILNANTNLVANKNYFANTQTTLTLTLPATANIGDTIRVFDNEGYASANVVTISRNGNKIDGFDRNVVISTDRDGVELVYVSGDIGFVTREAISEKFAFSPYQGDISGYAVGGGDGLGGVDDRIDKFPFATDTNATDVGNLTQARLAYGNLQQSKSFGYLMGGNSPTPTQVNTIDKFPFAVDTNASDVGDLGTSNAQASGQSSDVSGYMTNGFTPPSYTSLIQKIPFATDTNASSVGNSTDSRRLDAGHSSEINGYSSGGNDGSAKNVIDKFPFASDDDSSDVGDLTRTVTAGAGASSQSHGYNFGGSSGPTGVTIDKFPFATDTNATDIADLTVARQFPGGHSSTTHGYASGGNNPPDTSVIDKFPFASDSNATSVGNLSQFRTQAGGTHV